MVERKGTVNSGGVAKEFIQEFLIRRDQQRKFLGVEWETMKQRLTGAPMEEAVTATRVLFREIRTDFRPLYRDRAVDLVTFLYEELDMPDSVYVEELAKLSTVAFPNNVIAMMRIAPHVVREEKTFTHFVSTVDSLGVYYRENTSIVREIAKQKSRVRAAMIAAKEESVSVANPGNASGEIIVFRSNGLGGSITERTMSNDEAYRSDPPKFMIIRKELPELWNEYQLTIGQIARLYSVSPGCVKLQIEWLRANNVFLIPRERRQGRNPLSAKIERIDSLADRFSQAQVSQILDLGMPVVQQYWPRSKQD